MATHPSLGRAQRLVRLAAYLVPARLRSDWLREWEGELAAAADEGGNTPLVRHARGAFSDAFWIRQRDVADFEFIDDLRHGVRQLRQHAGFAVTTIGILSLSMAASVTAFSVVSQILLRPLPYHQPDRIVTVSERLPSTAGRSDVAPGNFLDWRQRATSFTKLAGVEPYSFDYTGGERPEVVRAVLVTEGFFETFGITPAVGRFFLPEEHTSGGARAAVMSARFWRSHFNADPAIVGKTIPLDDGQFLVAGILPDDFLPHFQEDVPGQTALYVAKVIQEFEPRIRTGGYWSVTGRLKEGVSLTQANAELDALSVQLERENPRSNKGLRAEAITLREHLVGDVRPAVTLFGGAVIAVLLIACVNITNLLLARGAVRQQELAVLYGARRQSQTPGRTAAGGDLAARLGRNRRGTVPGADGDAVARHLRSPRSVVD